MMEHNHIAGMKAHMADKTHEIILSLKQVTAWILSPGSRTQVPALSGVRLSGMDHIVCVTRILDYWPLVAGDVISLNAFDCLPVDCDQVYTAAMAGEIQDK